MKDCLVLLAYVSSTASITLSQQLLACLNFTLAELYFSLRSFILMGQMQKATSMNCGSSPNSWEPWGWVRLDLILTMMDIYINSNLNQLTKFTSSSRSTKLKDIFPWNISQMIRKNVPVSTRIVISYTMKLGIPFWVWWKDNGNWDNKSYQSYPFDVCDCTSTCQHTWH